MYCGFQNIITTYPEQIILINSSLININNVPSKIYVAIAYIFFEKNVNFNLVLEQISEFNYIKIVFSDNKINHWL